MIRRIESTPITKGSVSVNSSKLLACDLVDFEQRFEMVCWLGVNPASAGKALCWGWFTRSFWNTMAGGYHSAGKHLIVLLLGFHIDTRLKLLYPTRIKCYYNQARDIFNRVTKPGCLGCRDAAFLVSSSVFSTRNTAVSQMAKLVSSPLYRPLFYLIQLLSRLPRQCSGHTRHQHEI